MLQLFRSNQITKTELEKKNWNAIHPIVKYYTNKGFQYVR